MALRLAPADIFLFEPKNDCISRLICLLDDSKVSHSALYYYADNHLMAESHLSGLEVSRAPGPPGDAPLRTVHVRRYADPSFDGKKVVEKARFYVTRGESYGFGTLLLLGTLLITKRFLDNSKYLEKLEELLRFINSILLKGKKHPMKCSQFVGQAYGDAKYRLDRRADKADLAGVQLSITHPAVEQLGSMKNLPISSETYASHEGNRFGGIETTLEKFCCWLERRLSTDAPPAEISSSIPNSLVSEIAVFAGIIVHGEQFSTTTYSPSQAVSAIQELNDSFLSPGDLLECSQLITVGEIQPNK